MPVLLLSQLCQFGAYAFFVPASVYYINERVPDQYKVTGQSALGMATMGLGGAVGNFLGGRVQMCSVSPAWWWSRDLHHCRGDVYFCRIGKKPRQKLKRKLKNREISLTASKGYLIFVVG